MAATLVHPFIARRAAAYCRPAGEGRHDAHHRRTRGGARGGRALPRRDHRHAASARDRRRSGHRQDDGLARSRRGRARPAGSGSSRRARRSARPSCRTPRSQISSAPSSTTRAPELPLPQQRALDAALLRADPEADADVRTVGDGARDDPGGSRRRRGRRSWRSTTCSGSTRASTRALEFAARRLPAGIGLLLTHRSGASAEAPLGLDRGLPEEQRETVVLGPLSLAALHHLLRNNRLGTLRRVRRSSASPTLPAATPSSRWRSHVRSSAMPATARSRIPYPFPSGCTSSSQHASARFRARRGTQWSIASALSRPTTATVAGALGADEAARAGLSEAEEAGVLVTERARIRFSHPLLASAVYASLPAAATARAASAARPRRGGRRGACAASRAQRDRDRRGRGGGARARGRARRRGGEHRMPPRSSTRRRRGSPRPIARTHAPDGAGRRRGAVRCRRRRPRTRARRVASSPRRRQQPRASTRSSSCPPSPRSPAPPTRRPPISSGTRRRRRRPQRCAASCTRCSRCPTCIPIRSRTTQRRRCGCSTPTSNLRSSGRC